MRKAGGEGHKKESRKASMKAGSESPVEKNGDFNQKIPWKQITSGDTLLFLAEVQPAFPPHAGKALAKLEQEALDV